MRDYGKVYTAFWTSQDVISMSEDGRTLAMYLLTCPHGNMLGCFRLTNAYAADDLRWDIERVSKGFAELFEKGYAYRCERSFWVVIHRYLKWNQFENPNVGKAAGKLFETIAPPNDVKALLAKALRDFCPTFPAQILDKFETLSKPFRNSSVLSPETVVGTRAGIGATTGANPHVEQTQLDLAQVKAEELARLEKLEAEAKAKREAEEKARIAAETLTIFQYWQKVMSSPKSVLDENRKGLIHRALEKYSPVDICKAIRGCSKSPYNMGQNDRNTKFNGLDLILRNANKIDYFINLDGANAKASTETIEQKNERIMAEVLGVAEAGRTIDMES